MQIYPIRLGITLGIIWGFCVLSLAFLANKEYGMPLFHMISQVYVGCSQKDTLSKFICGMLSSILGNWICHSQPKTIWTHKCTRFPRIT